jgi:hypothetical protein
MESWKRAISAIRDELPKRNEVEVSKRLSAVSFVEQTEEGTYGINKELMSFLQDSPGISSYHDYDVRTEYPRTELFLIALLSENPASYEAFLEEQMEEEQKNKPVIKATMKGMKGRLQARDIKASPLLAHDFGLGLPSEIEPPLKDKKILFVGGGSSGRLLLPRFKSDGASVVNIDPYAQGIEVAESWMNRFSEGGNGGTGEISEVQAFFTPKSAEALVEDCDGFDAVVIQNVFDTGSVDSKEEVLQILEGLRLVAKKGTILLVQIDSLPDEMRNLIVHEFMMMGFSKRAELETYEGQRGQGLVFERL